MYHLFYSPCTLVPNNALTPLFTLFGKCTVLQACVSGIKVQVDPSIFAEVISVSCGNVLYDLKIKVRVHYTELKDGFIVKLGLNTFYVLSKNDRNSHFCLQ